MENKFYKDDFEQFLKDSADEFRMYPSKRVWNSLYNNLHPGRKWPSLAVCLLLVSSIVFIGLSHKNEISGSANSLKQDSPAVIALANPDHQAKNKSSIVTPENSGMSRPVNIENNKTESTKKRTFSTTVNRNKEMPAVNPRTQISDRTFVVTNTIKHNNGLEQHKPASTKKQQVFVNQASAFSTILSAAENDEVDIAKQRSAVIIMNKRLTENDAAIKLNKEKNQVKIIEAKIVSPSIKIKTLSLSVSHPVKKDQDKEWIEDYAFHNQPDRSFKSSLKYQLYFTPSIGYRILTKEVTYSVPARSSILSTVSDEHKDILQQNATLNLEAGLSFIHAYTKTFRLKAGMQFNYTNYRTHAHDMGHSGITSLVLKDPNSGGINLSQRSTTLSNLPGAASDKKLNNTTFQVSLPVGADIKIAGKNNIQWFAGATIQPVYILFGNAYLISSDMKNYVYDASFLRKWNADAAIETFISYKAKHGVIFNAGPQLRYQLFSTYRKGYSYTEKLYNIGVKVGMIRNL